MPYDKVVDSAELDAGLKQIADAIREKGGTSDTLAFPTAMAEAIAAIEAGGGAEIYNAHKIYTGTFTFAENTVASSLEAIITVPDEDSYFWKRGFYCVIYDSSSDTNAFYTGETSFIGKGTANQLFMLSLVGGIIGNVQRYASNMYYKTSSYLSSTTNFYASDMGDYTRFYVSSDSSRFFKGGTTYCYLVWCNAATQY